jgi:hypothetical protein
MACCWGIWPFLLHASLRGAGGAGARADRSARQQAPAAAAGGGGDRRRRSAGARAPEASPPLGLAPEVEEAGLGGRAGAAGRLLVEAVQRQLGVVGQRARLRGQQLLHELGRAVEHVGDLVHRAARALLCGAVCGMGAVCAMGRGPGERAGRGSMAGPHWGGRRWFVGCGGGAVLCLALRRRANSKPQRRGGPARRAESRARRPAAPTRPAPPAPPEHAAARFMHALLGRCRTVLSALRSQAAPARPCPAPSRRRCTMASTVLAAASENVAPMDANPAPAKAPRIEVFKVKRIHDDAVLPRRGSDKAAGYDLSRCGRCFPPSPRLRRLPPSLPVARARARRVPALPQATPADRRPLARRPRVRAAARTPWCPRAARCA